MLTHNHPFTSSFAASLLLFLLLAPAAPVLADGRDTPADVAAAGAAGAAKLEPLSLALSDALAVMKKMETDPTWQKTCLELAAKNDLAGLSSFLKRAAPNSTVNVTGVDDFTLRVSFATKSVAVSVCVSSSSSCAGGSRATVGVAVP